LSAKIARNLQAIHKRHHHVQNNDVEGGCLSQTQPGSAIVRDGDAERLLFETSPHILCYFTVVINKQDAHFA
jgi:hypothetical protein